MKKGIHSIFRIRRKASKLIDVFIASDETDKVVQVKNPNALKSERGVKQELFAHFILITLTKIFSISQRRPFEPI